MLWLMFIYLETLEQMHLQIFYQVKLIHQENYHTYPLYPNSLLPYYYKPSEVQNNAQGAYNYVGEVNNLYDFGFGLSYPEFV